jgi:hypothetical protein
MQEEIAQTTANPPQPQAPEPSLWAKTKDVFTGSLRETPEMEGMESLAAMGGANIIAPNDGNKQMAFAAETATMFDPNEIAKVAIKYNPELQIRYNKDAQGKVFPILSDPKTGRNVMVNPPGMDYGDVGRGIVTATMFTPQGKISGPIASKVSWHGRR